MLLLVSLGVGVFTADLPFWRRALQLPLPADGAYLPVASIGAPRPPLPAQDAAPCARPAIDALVVEEAVNRARDAGSRALLVMYRGDARAWSAISSPTTRARLLPAGAGGAAAGGDGRWASRSPTAASPRSTAPVARYLPEWDDEPRGRITLRQLLEETSGLETGGDTRGLLYRSPWGDLAHLPAFATSRGVRMLLGNDFESSALGFRLEHEPGGFYNLSPANTQLAAVIVERATGEPYETLRRRSACGAPVGGGQRRAAARPARRHARGALLLARDGARHAARAEPARHRWRITRARGAARGLGARDGAASRVNAETGMQVARLSIDGDEALGVTDDNGSAFWVIPQRQLAILNIANPGGGSSPELPAHVAEGLAADPRLDDERKYRVAASRAGAQNARHGYESHFNAHSMADGFLDSREFARMTRAIEFIEREYERQPKLARNREGTSGCRNFTSTACSGAGPGSRPSSTSPKSPAARPATRCATSLRCWTPLTL